MKLKKTKKIGIGVGISVVAFFVFIFSMMSGLYVERISKDMTAYTDWNLEDYSIDDCLKVKRDKDGFLEKICRYIIENKIAGAGDPTKIQIDLVQDQVYKGKEVYAVILNCCYTGDSAIIDKKTGEIITYRLGDM